MPKVYAEFEGYARKLEKHYQDVQDLEFTIERGKLWMLQTRSAKRTGEAAVNIAVDMVGERLITEEGSRRAHRAAPARAAAVPARRPQRQGHAARQGCAGLTGRRIRWRGVRRRHRGGVGQSGQGRDPGSRRDQSRTTCTAWSRRRESSRRPAAPRATRPWSRAAWAGRAWWARARSTSTSASACSPPAERRSKKATRSPSTARPARCTSGTCRRSRPSRSTSTARRARSCAGRTSSAACRFGRTRTTRATRSRRARTARRAWACAARSTCSWSRTGCPSSRT